jgi:hypothetical protein
MRNIEEHRYAVPPAGRFPLSICLVDLYSLEIASFLAMTRGEKNLYSHTIPLSFLKQKDV